MMEACTIKFEELGAAIGGQLVTAADPDWDTSRMAWNLAVDQRPEAVVFAESTEDAATVVEFAERSGLRVAPQATGHNAGAQLPLEGAILLKLDRMRGVEIDAQRQTAQVRAGTQWGEVAEAAMPHGLAPLSGSAPDVGVIGYTLGGGLSWMGRKYGLACNSVVAAVVVTSGGAVLRVDAENDADLFWAVRGGGGNFGVVTELEFKLFPHAQLYAGNLFWPMERAREVIQRWSEWVETVPEEVTSLARLLRVPPLPEIPEPVRGKSFVVVEAAVIGDESMAELFAPLRDLDPAMDTLAMIPPPGLAALHMDPPEPVPGTGNGFNLRELTSEAIDGLVGGVGAKSGSPLLSFEIRHLGGALGRATPDTGALSHLDSKFACYAVGMTPDAQAKHVVDGALAEVEQTFGEWLADSHYVNFSENSRHPEAYYTPEALERLRQIKVQRDPNGVFQSNPVLNPA